MIRKQSKKIEIVIDIAMAVSDFDFGEIGLFAGLLLERTSKRPLKAHSSHPRMLTLGSCSERWSRQQRQPHRAGYRAWDTGPELSYRPS